MAVLQSTTINTGLTTTSFAHDTGADISEWYKLNNCDCHSGLDGRSDCLGNGYPWLHIRTPWPADAAAGLGWNPYMIEVVGYHTYSGEKFHDWKGIVNTTGDGNDTFYSPTIRSNTGNSSAHFYRSVNTYGGFRRLVVVVEKISCCCTGFLWIRARQNSGFRANFPWATTMWSTQTGTAY